MTISVKKSAAKPVEITLTLEPDIWREVERSPEWAILERLLERLEVDSPEQVEDNNNPIGISG